MTPRTLSLKPRDAVSDAEERAATIAAMREAAAGYSPGGFAPPSGFVAPPKAPAPALLKHQPPPLQKAPAPTTPRADTSAPQPTPLSLRPGDAVIDPDPPKFNEREVLIELHRLRVRKEAERLLDREDRGDPPPPEILTLRERLSRPRTHPRWSIPGWQPRKSRVICAAQFKAGKTTLVANYLRSLIDGDRFLDVADVAPVEGTVALIDVEMNATQLEDWLAAQQIRADDRVLLIPLRGQVAAFDILDPRTRTWWATELRERQVSCLVLDCLRPVLDALGFDEHSDAGRFLVAFDALLREAAIDDALVIHHMGHLGERSRGDSRLRDWPDVEWRLVRQDDDPGSPRFLSAYGRDVNQLEQQLEYDASSRRLTVCGGSRQDAKTEAALAAITAALTARPEPRSGRTLKGEFAESEYGRDLIDKALHHGEQTGRLVMTRGAKNAKLYSLPVS